MLTYSANDANETKLQTTLPHRLHQTAIIFHIQVSSFNLTRYWPKFQTDFVDIANLQHNVCSTQFLQGGLQLYMYTSSVVAKYVHSV